MHLAFVVKTQLQDCLSTCFNALSLRQSQCILFPQVGDKEMFVSEEEVGGSREALQELINKGETEVAVKHYKEEVRKLLGLPETLVSPEFVETQPQQ